MNFHAGIPDVRFLDFRVLDLRMLDFKQLDMGVQVI